MPAQRALLRVLIASLAAAGLLGAAVVLTASNEIADKMIGTLLLTAMCSGLLLGAAHLLSGPDTKAAASLMTTLVVVVFSLGASLIWAIPGQFGIDPDKVAALIPALAGPGLAAVFCLASRHERWLVWSSWLGLALSAAVFLLWLKAVGFGETGYFDEDSWWQYGGWLAAMGTLACLSMVGTGTDGWHWRWIGFVFAVAAYIVIIPLVEQPKWHPEPVDGLITLAALIVYANLILRAPLRNGSRWIIYGSVAIAAATGWFLNEALMNDIIGNRENWSDVDRLAAAGGILSGFGTIIVAVLTQLRRRAAANLPGGAGPPDVIIVCPLCGKRQTLTHGHGPCDRCGAMIHVTIDAPPAAGASALPS